MNRPATLPPSPGARWLPAAALPLLLGVLLLLGVFCLARGPLAALDLALLAEAEALNRLPIGLILPELPPAAPRPGG
ncbi:hypothetical protein [Pseudoroseomonas cervicalis]|uniref:hypothetical protein n=1 Tax=Teichococcus cervicalis TaxID=204525 RepID=UPI00278115FB|nr:hypothetical protein [Pseudoroseomonas cervicalis]MDQ1078227.1 hypothetical protein [Pseudoroseomonas cervicalis]